MVVYKIFYFNGRGKAEIIRQILRYAGEKFEDVRYTHEEWAEKKNDTPYGQLPVLEFDGKKLGQSFAIARFLARKYGLAGKTELEEALVDSLADQWSDYQSEIKPFLMVLVGMVAGDLDKLKHKVFDAPTKKNFAIFNKQLKRNNTGFLVGDSLTWVDLLVAESVADISEQYPTTVDKLPELKTHERTIHSLPAIKKWRKMRPETPF